MRKLMSLLALSIMVACKSYAPQAGDPRGSDNSDLGKLSTPASGEENAELLEEMYCLELSDPKDIEDSTAYKETTLLDYQITDGCLCIEYQFSGCVKGKPRLIVWKEVTDLPTRPKVYTSLWVKDSGLCEQLLTTKTCFSMKRMQLIGNEVLLFINNDTENVLVKTQN